MASSRIYQTFILFWAVIIAQALSKSVRQLDCEKEKLENYIESKKPEIIQRFRPFYHIAAPVGWINDPNGFSYYKGEYHLFYQFYPYDSVWGPMHWGHVSSKDLVTWKQLPTALLPENEQCFSGSAVVDNDNLILIYTGHVITDTESYNQSQYIAFSDDGVDFTKYEGNPVIAAAPNGSPDFRDPKAWKHGDYWYVILGSKTEDERGRVLLYKSLDMINWDFVTVLGESDGSLGYMWECPDFFELDGKYVLLMSPQGIEPQGDRFHNIYQTGYILGDFSYETFEFIPQVEFQEIDFGHDFYAAQTTEVDGKRYLVGWFNSWEKEIPETDDGWSGIMTIVRELRLVGDKIHMIPVEAMTSLRDGVQYSGYLDAGKDIELHKSSEILITFDSDYSVEILIEGANGGDQIWLEWDVKHQRIAVERNGEIRKVEWNPLLRSQTWRVFLDASSLELFCGDGEAVFSSRVYPDGNWKMTNTGTQKLELESYWLKRSVPE